LLVVISGNLSIPALGSLIVRGRVPQPSLTERVQMLRVKDDNRRQGIGGALIRDLAHHRTTEKLFTSTNLSNHPMQTLLSKLGWESAGIVYGLDDGDPELFYRAPTKTVQ
jgi:GNAT superfamily N-acetyltransferase